MAVLTIADPLLVFGVLTFEIQAPIALAAFCLWLFLVNRGLRRPSGRGWHVSGSSWAPAPWPALRSVMTKMQSSVAAYRGREGTQAVCRFVIDPFEWMRARMRNKEARACTE
jgi:hypothetical protein